MRVGGASFRSPRTTVRFTSSELNVKSTFNTVAKRISKCSGRFVVRRVIWVWTLIAILLIVPATLAIPFIYHSFHSHANHDNITAQTVLLAFYYLIGIPVSILTGMSVTAAGVTLPSARIERIGEALLRLARGISEIWGSIGRDTKVLAIIGIVGIIVALLAWLRPFLILCLQIDSIDGLEVAQAVIFCGRAAPVNGEKDAR
jgi:hypothetical protein